MVKKCWRRGEGGSQGYAVLAFPLASRGFWSLPPGAGEGREGGEETACAACPVLYPTLTLPHLRGRENTVALWPLRMLPQNGPGQVQ